MAEFERTRRNYPRRNVGAIISDEETNIDKRLQELQMYEPGMTLDHKKKVIAFIEESMGTSVMESDEDFSSSPSLSSRARLKKPAHVKTGPEVLQENDERESGLLSEVPDANVPQLLQARKERQVSEPDEASRLQNKTDPSSSEVVEVSDDSDTSLENREAKPKEEPVKRVTKKYFTELEERALLVQPFLALIESAEPSPLPPFIFDEEEFQKNLTELTSHTEMRLREVLSCEGRAAVRSTPVEGPEELEKRPAAQARPVSKVTPPVSAMEPKEGSCCPICGRSFPAEELEGHASECFNYEGLDAPTKANAAATVKTNLLTLPSTTAHSDSGPDIEEIDQNDRKRHNSSAAGRRTRQREKRQKH